MILLEHLRYSSLSIERNIVDLSLRDQFDVTKVNKLFIIHKRDWTESLTFKMYSIH